jgi:spectinomycin phosphotransferase
MRSLPEGLHEGEVITSLAEGWGLDVNSARYAPVGFGSYHWDVTDATGRRYFVTADDLDHKAWLGHDRESVFAGLRGAFDAAVALRGEGGLQFVVAPIPAVKGESVRRISTRHTVALFPFLDGSHGRFGEGSAPAGRADVIDMLAELHRATRVVLPVARRCSVDLAERRPLEAALRELDRTWTGGPFSEPARDLLARNAAGLQGRLQTFDRLAAEVAAAGADLVITHGEPHAGNVLRTADGILLVDWDTIGLALPERDLTLVTSDAGELALYTEATGRSIDLAAIALYRLRWELDDIAIYTTLFRSVHAYTADTEKAWRGLSDGVKRDDRWR